MYRAHYDYEALNEQCFSVRKGDRFTVIDAVSKDWLRAQNGLGMIRLVPAKYVEKVQISTEEILKFVDNSIDAIHLLSAGESGGHYSHEQREALQKLVKHRQDLATELQSPPPQAKPDSKEGTDQRGANESENDEPSHRRSSRRKAPPPPTVSVEGPKPASYKNHAPPVPAVSGAGSKPPDVEAGFSTSPGAADTVPSPQLNNSQTVVMDCSPGDGLMRTVATVEADLAAKLPSLHESLDGRNLKSATSAETASVADVRELLKNIELPEKIGPELLEEVRKSTGLSFEKCKVAVETVLAYVGFKVQALEGTMDRILNSVHFGRDISDEDISSHDAKRLDIIFSELTACKDDSQQRSWALHEDEAIIQEYLQELLSILENAKPSICRKVVCRESYEILHNLVQYYQMETRGLLCRLLLQVFGALCALEKAVILNLLYSVLPLELAQELVTPTDDVQRVCYAALVMTMIFSTGDAISTAVTDQLGEEFFLKILQLVEEPPSAEFEDTAVNHLISFVLAFNLHLMTVEANVVLKALATAGTAKVFTEHIMVLLNRGDDPVKIFNFKPRPPNSVLKLFQDLYSDPSTSDLLYTNDAKVLIDVILGRLTNLEAGDPIRSSFLTLCQLMLRNSSYKEHCHHANELQKVLSAIRSEESTAEDDQRVAQEILSAHQDIFV